MNKICSKCLQEKDISFFHKDLTHKDGHKNICKQCLSRKKTFKKNNNPKLNRNIKQNLNYCLKNDGPFSWGRILGYDKQQLKEHLESLFTEEMSWDNYGEYWKVGFFIPKRLYQISNVRSPDFKSFWALKNLKPIKATELHKQKAILDLKLIEEYSLWDILPVGNIAPLLDNNLNIENIIKKD